MMSISQHRLWIARMERPYFQRKLLNLIRQKGGMNCMVQPTLTKENPGFLRELKDIPRRLAFIPAEVRETRHILARVASLSRRTPNRRTEVTQSVMSLG